MPDNITPEEKLLNLIKGSKKKEEAQKAPTPALPPVDKEEKKPEPQVAKAPHPSPKGKEKKKAKQKVKVPKAARAGGRIEKKGPKLRNPLNILNKLLILVLLGVIVYFIFGYIFPYKSQTEIPEDISTLKTPELAGRKIEELPPLGDYTKTVGKRKMFKLYEVPKPRPTGPTKPKVTLQQLLAGYTFVGIIFGDPPQAIIEEKRSRQSYYLSAGQTIGEIKIENIERGKVTVSYGEEVMDVRI